jgi:rare lipoprotein A (peptidoglycan hydrolase)
VRLPRVVASLTLIVALALVALPELAASHNASPADAIDATLFHRVETASRIRDTAATTFSLDPELASAATLRPDSALVEPAAARAERPGAVVPGAPRGVVVPATPRPRPVAAAPAIGSITAPASGWRRDPEVSWYGPGFYGHRTACGKTLTTTLLGVAHKSLPCGTMVSFRNAANGRTVTVPVVDRGPYVAGRQWDLTAATCRAIAHCFTGPLQWRFP